MMFAVPTAADGGAKERTTRRRHMLLALAAAARRDAARVNGHRASVLREHARELELRAAWLDATT